MPRWPQGNRVAHTIYAHLDICTCCLCLPFCLPFHTPYPLRWQTDRCLFRSSQRLDRISKQVCFVGPWHTSSLGSVGRLQLLLLWKEGGGGGGEKLGWGFLTSAYPGAPPAWSTHACNAEIECPRERPSFSPFLFLDLRHWTDGELAHEEMGTTMVMMVT